ncbi:MAG: hypothetical protein AAFV46_09675 [Cyanobacteria bacterium J06635_11]
MNTIPYYCDTPAIQHLCALYGPRWEAMPLSARTDILALLSIAANFLCVEGETQRLDELADAFGIEFPDEAIPDALSDLDGELNGIQDALMLIAGIAQTTPPQILEQAA